MAVEIFHDQIFTKRCAGREDRSRCPLIPKRHRYQPSESVLEQDYKKMYTPVQSSFTVGKWIARGSHLHGYVILMKIQKNIS